MVVRRRGERTGKEKQEGILVSTQPQCWRLCQGPLHSPAPARTLSTVRRCTLEVVHDVVIVVLSIALLSTESASLYPFGPSNLGAADATPRLTKPPCGGLLSLPHTREHHRDTRDTLDNTCHEAG